MLLYQLFFAVLVTFSVSGKVVCDTKPLNILFVVNCFPKLSETFILNQVTGVLDAGHNVYIYAKEKEQARSHESYYKYNLQQRVQYHIATSRSKKAFFSKNRFDIVLCHFGDRGYMGHKLIEQYKIHAPLITFFHGVDMSTSVDVDPGVYDELFTYLDLALPISEYWQKRLVGLGYDQEKICVHYLGIDCEKFNYQQRVHSSGQLIRFITISRLVEKKGIEYALRAFAEITKENENIEYVLIGDGPLRKSLEKLIKKLGIANKVRLLGSRTQEEIRELSKDAHIFLAPSITAANGDTEGIPVSIMEAMAMGLPVISTHHSGIPELVQDGVTGFLVNEKNVLMLSERMRNMINHPELWSVMGKAGRDRVFAEFNAQKQNDRLVEIFNECIARKSES